jgi:hypothetical protein
MAEIQRVLGRYRPPIIRRHYDYDCQTDLCTRRGGYYGEPIIGAKSRRILWIPYHKFNELAERINTLISAIFDKHEAPEGKYYILSTDTYDPNSRSYVSNFLDSATSWCRSMEALARIVHVQINTRVLAANSSQVW